MIKETFNQPYPMVKGMLYDPPEMYEYEFINDQGIRYIIEIGETNNKRYYFQFQALEDKEGIPYEHPQNKLGTGDAFKVFSTVVKALEDFLKNNTNFRLIEFSAESKSRRKLYEKMVSTIASRYNLDYKIDKSEGWKWKFYLIPNKKLKFNRYYSENEEVTIKGVKKLQHWINKNLHTYKTVGRSSILSGGKIKEINRQPNSYTKMIMSGAFKGQADNTGFIVNIGEYTIYAIEAEVVMGVGAQFQEKAVMMQIDKGKQPYKTYMMSATNLQSIKSLLGI